MITAFTARLKSVPKSSFNHTSSFGRIKWSNTDFERLNIVICVKMTKYGMPQTSEPIQRIVVPSLRGGRGVVDVNILTESDILCFITIFKKDLAYSHLNFSPEGVFNIRADTIEE